MIKEYNHTQLPENDVIKFLVENVRPFFNSRFYDWEFRHFKERVVFKLLKSDSTIIASQAMLPVKLLVNNTVVETAKSETSFLSPEFRGQNHFENVYFSAIDDCHRMSSMLIWGFTPAVKVWKNKLKFEVVLPNISEARLQLSKYPTAGYLRKNNSPSMKRFAKGMFYRLARLTEPRKKIHLFSADQFVVKSAVPPVEQIQDFQLKMISAFGISVSIYMGADYLQWRIFGNPMLKYETRFFYRDNVLAGYLIFSVKNDRLSVADISFLKPEIAVEMMNFLLADYMGKVQSVFYFGNDDSAFNAHIFKIFSDQGATISKSDWANTVIKDISGTGRFLQDLDTSKWLINGLWTEGFSI